MPRIRIDPTKRNKAQGTLPGIPAPATKAEYVQEGACIEPVPTAEIRKPRELIAPSKGHTFVAIDAEQLERDVVRAMTRPPFIPFRVFALAHPTASIADAQAWINKQAHLRQSA